MKKVCLLMASVLMATLSCNEKFSDSPLMLKTEYGSIIVDTDAPRFSWQLSDTTRGVHQTAYEILVASKKSDLTERKADAWSSGKVSSDQSVFVEYSGSELEGGKRYFWKVRTWDRENKPSGWSEPAYFDTGLRDEQWIANWIGAYDSEVKDGRTVPKSILLRKELEIDKPVELAKIYVTGLGSYRLYLDGNKVSDDLLTPGWTDYPTRIMYQVYDITEELSKGNHALGLMMGNVWYSSGLGWNGGRTYSKGPMMALLQLHVEYKDGSSEDFVTDGNWKWHYSPLVENTLYHGEVYDARKEIKDWSKPGLADSLWQAADVFEKQEAILSAHTSPAIQITRIVTPKKISKLENGSFVFDMGYNMTGGIRLKVEGEKGTEIILKYAELLHNDGTVAQENLRTAKATDTYILKGEGLEIWEPSFTYHGFRYVEISGLPAEPDSSVITGLNFHNAAPETGVFECSNELINKIQANIQNGQRSNMFSVPTDCPQRDERLGWMGDAQIFAATSCYNMDMSGFYAKWIRDIYDCQDAEGWVTDVNPAIVVTDPAKPAWGDAYTIVPWELYRFYGDKGILEKYYDGYKAWVEYMRKKANDDGLYIYDKNGWGGYADWIAVKASPQQPVSAAYYYFSASLLARFAMILNYEDDYKEYSSLASQIREAYQDTYFTKEGALYPGETQTAYLLPLSFGICPEDQRNAVFANLYKNVQDEGVHPTTGFLGTKYLLPVLSDYGYHETAYEMVCKEDYPSWGYMVRNGATSMWELWNSDTEPPERMNSRNHFALGSVGEWFYSHLAGIRIDEDNPGFKHSIIAPMPAKGLDWAKACIKTAYGDLCSAWKKDSTALVIQVTIPANTSATVVIPAMSKNINLKESGIVLLEKGNLVKESANIILKEVKENSIVLEVESGRYRFEVEEAK